jgi:hypothetical protein
MPLTNFGGLVILLDPAIIGLQVHRDTAVWRPCNQAPSSISLCTGVRSDIRVRGGTCTGGRLTFGHDFDRKLQESSKEGQRQKSLRDFL